MNDIPSSVQIDSLENGDLSLGFLRLPVPAKLKQIPLLEDKLVLVINSSIDSKLDPLIIIESYPFLSLTENRGPGLDFQISQFLRFNKIDINRVNNSDDIQTLLAMISSGIGISTLLESSILRRINNIKTIPLSGKYTKWSVGIVWNDKIENKARDLFLKTFEIK